MNLQTISRISFLFLLTSCMSFFSDFYLTKLNLYLNNCSKASKNFSYIRKITNKEQKLGLKAYKKCKKQKDFKSAALFLEKISSSSLSQDQIFDLATIYLKDLKNSKKSLDSINQISEQLLKPKLGLLKAKILKTTNPKKSLTLLNFLIKKFPDNTDFLLEKSSLLFLISTPTEKLNFFDSQLEKLKTKPRFIEYYIFSLEELGKYREALKFLEENLTPLSESRRERLKRRLKNKMERK